MTRLSINETRQSSRWIAIQALIVFGWAMLTHTLLMLVVDVSLPSKLPQILMALSATLIYDSALLIDLVRGPDSIPVAYSPMDIFVLGVVPWLIAGTFSVCSSKSTWDSLRGAIMGVMLGVLVFFYVWVGIGGFPFVGFFLALQFFVGSLVNMVLASIGAACGIKLRPWFQKLLKRGRSQTQERFK